MKHLLKITEKILDQYIGKLGAIEAHILLNWKNIAKEYATITKPKKIIFDKRTKNKGKLILNVQNSFGPIVQQALPFILNQINSRFGFKAIDKIKLIQTDIGFNAKIETDKTLSNIPKKKENLISNVLPDGDLKFAMQKLEISIQKKN